LTSNTTVQFGDLPGSLNTVRNAYLQESQFFLETDTLIPENGKLSTSMKMQNFKQNLSLMEFFSHCDMFCRNIDITLRGRVCL